jgi:hypothetical protein
LALAVVAVRNGDRLWLALVGPLLGVVIAAAYLGRVPLDARWAVARPAFDAAVRTVPAYNGVDGQQQSADVPREIGGYRIVYATVVPAGVIFYEETGALFDDAGFAYLPDGPSDSLANTTFEAPRFHSLGGPWYSWTASW